LKIEIKNILPLFLWHRLGENEKYASFTWSRNRYGWKKIIAFNPSSIYIYNDKKKKINLENFISENKNKLLIGYISYNLGYKIYNIKSNIKDDLNLPLIYFLVYDDYVEFDKNIAILNFTNYNFVKKIKSIIKRTAKTIDNHPIFQFEVQIEKSEYENNIIKIQNYIRIGDVYQVNYTHRLQSQFTLEKRNLFPFLLMKNPVNFACYLEGDNFSINSLSPERFVRIKDNTIVSFPIKGTRKRGKNKDEDKNIERELRTNAKEQAELFMITDLIRNDLGKICEIGSVQVQNRKKIHRLPKIMHTYSVVRGKLRNDISAINALLSMFPGGSITGCPKKSAMKIIDEIETFQRGVYTGSIGYIVPNKEMEFNIAIRTVVQKNENLYLGVGGGITIESNIKDEYQESLAKAASFL
jgi:para-aminobenzoate synthetase component 1